jgi:hypothetical protein
MVRRERRCQKQCFLVKFQILAVVSLKIRAFRDVMLCHCVSGSWWFAGPFGISGNPNPTIVLDPRKLESLVPYF